jgi:hypothetical protein
MDLEGKIAKTLRCELCAECIEAYKLGYQECRDELEVHLKKLQEENETLKENYKSAALEVRVAATRGRIDSAIRRIYNKFDEWNSVTGFVAMHTGYYYELQSILEDAVHCGVQALLDVKEPLPSEKDTKTTTACVGGGALDDGTPVAVVEHFDTSATSMVSELVLFLNMIKILHADAATDMDKIQVSYGGYVGFISRPDSVLYEWVNAAEKLVQRIKGAMGK